MNNNSNDNDNKITMIIATLITVVFNIEIIVSIK